MEWAAWRTGVFMGALDQALERHSEWTVVRHEQLCIDPAVRYRSLAADLGLRWGRGAEQRVVDFDRPGDDAYDTTRVARDEPERWRERLTEGEVEVIIETLDRFPLRAYGSAVLRAAARSVPE